MKRMTLTKMLCVVFCLILLASAVPVMPLRLLAATDQFSFAPQVSEVASDYDVSMHGELVGLSWNISGVLEAWHYSHVCGTLNLPGIEE